MIEQVARRLDVIRKFLFIATGLMVVAIPAALGQAPTSSAPAAPQVLSLPANPLLKFDVASIKINKDETGPRQLIFPANGDGLRITNVHLSSIIRYAYDIQNGDLLSGAPDWARSDGYDIQAKVADADLTAYHKLNNAQRRLMIQALLENRFKLNTHRGPMEIPIYALAVGRNGPKMKEVKPDDAHPDGPKRSDGSSYQGPTCFASSDTPGQLNCQATNMVTLANMLTAAGHTGRLVVDKTGLTGTYDFNLRWTPETPDQRIPDMPNAANREESSSPSDPTGTSIFNALQQQLGLRLESRKDLVEGLIIDHLERPAD